MKKQKWNKDSIIREAQKYVSPAEIRRKNPNLYAAISRYSLREHAYKHMNLERTQACVGCGDTFTRPLSGKGWNTRVFCDACRGNTHYGQRRLKHKSLMSSLGITLHEHEKMKESQGNKCAACGDMFSNEQKDVHTDHCHETGQIRGILCRGCNLALGHASDSVERLKLLIKYLEKNR